MSLGPALAVDPPRPLAPPPPPPPPPPQGPTPLLHNLGGLSLDAQPLRCTKRALLVKARSEGNASGETAAFAQHTDASQVVGSSSASTDKRQLPLLEGQARAPRDLAHVTRTGPRPGPSPPPGSAPSSSSSGAPSQARPRYPRARTTDMRRVRRCNEWEERTAHLISTSSRVQDYLRQGSASSSDKGPAAPTVGTQGTKRRRKSQDKPSAKRLRQTTPADAYPAIFARSSVLTRRFPSLARRD